MGRIKRNIKRRIDTVAALLMDATYINRTPDMKPPTAADVIAKPSIRRHGWTSRLTIAVFQNMMMRCNETDHRSDEQLSDVFNREFPRADVVVAHGGFPPKHWRNMRTQWNHGKHGVDDRNDDRPATPLARYDKRGDVITGPAPAGT